MPKVGDKELCTHFVMTYEDCYTGSRSTFEFPSQVNLSGPSLYLALGLAGATRLTRSDFMPHKG